VLLVLSKGKKLKVLFPFIRSDFGGSYVSAGLLARELLSMDVEVEIVFPGRGKGYEYFCTLGLYPKILLDYPTQDLSIWKHGPNFRSLIRVYRAIHLLIMGKYDLIHCNDDRTLLVWGLAAKLFKIKVVWHLRNSVMTKFDPLRLLISNSIIAVSEFTFKRIKHNNKGVVIYNPVEFLSRPESQSITRTSLGIPEDSIVICHIGRDVEKKKLEWSVNSTIDLELEGGPQIYLLCIGQISFDRERAVTLNALSRGLKETQIIFIQHTEYIIEYMQMSDVISHPSDGRYFGLDRVIQEALLLEKPISLNDSGANLELVQDSDIVYYTENIEQQNYSKCLRAAVEFVVNSPKVNSIYKSGSSDRFSVVEHAKSVLDTYVSINKR
jgi:glycosyltransferase involved in cell wall biosynthesis